MNASQRRHHFLRFVGTTAAALMLMTMVAAPATATTTYAVRAHFLEPIVPSLRSDCPVAPEGFCGSGRLDPFGRATETIEFGAGCGGGCDLRTVTLVSGTLVLDETFSDPACPGACRPNPASPASGRLTDVVIGGTGRFTGATGTLSGSVTAAGDWIPAGQSQVELAGALVLAG